MKNARLKPDALGRIYLERPHRPPPLDSEFSKFMLCVGNAKARSKKKGSEFSITREVAADLWRRCQGRCELTGIRFEFDESEMRYRRRPFLPSLDRIDNEIGYTVENVRVVCVAANLAMNQWGEAVLMRLAAALIETAAFGKTATQAECPTRLPVDVRFYRGKRRSRFTARVRDFGVEVHLGTFDTMKDALDARLSWARANSSLKVTQEVYDFTRNDELLNEINNLSLVLGGVANGTRTQAV